MVGPDGQAKVLDFGLAKAWEAEPGESASLSMSPTLTAQMTQAGVILGTASYMSPEQARGQEADKRADIWAFGVVLWEMLAGQRLFGGQTVSDTLAAVLRADPSWEALPPATQPSVRGLLRHCLERDPKERLHDIADARIVIRDSLEGTEDAGGVEPQALPNRRWLRLGATLLAGTLIGAALMTLGRPGEREDERAQLPIRAELNIAAEGLSEDQSGADIAISPDGSHLVFTAWDGAAAPLLRRSLNDRGTSAIPGTEGGYYPTFSPDGRWVAFFADGKLKKVSIEGGTAEILCDAPNPFGRPPGAPTTTSPSPHCRVKVSGRSPHPGASPRGSLPRVKASTTSATSLLHSCRMARACSLESGRGKTRAVWRFWICLVRRSMRFSCLGSRTRSIRPQDICSTPVRTVSTLCLSVSRITPSSVSRCPSIEVSTLRSTILATSPCPIPAFLFPSQGVPALASWSL